MTDRPRRPRIAVVGGGIAGLAAAWELRQLAASLGGGVEVVVHEAGGRVGGKLALQEVAGVVVDAGAESLLARRPEAVQLATAAGLGADLVTPSTGGARLWSRGSFHPLPRGQVLGVPADLQALAASGVLDRSELARVPLDRWLPRTHLGADVSVGAFVGRRLGRAVVDRLVEPLLGGVYAGSADQLSLTATMPALARAARDRRSLLAAAEEVRRAGPPGDTPVFAGISGGVGRLPAAVAAASGATIRTGSTVRALERAAQGWTLTVDGAPEHADAVVLAAPAPAAARLLSGVSGTAAADLARIAYASIALVTFAFPTEGSAALRQGTGFLVPPVEGRYAKAATFSSAKWGWVAAAGPELTIVRVSVGRHGEERDLQVDDGELSARALTDLQAMTGCAAVPVEAVVSRWGGALPQYAVGHPARVARVRRALADHPTLAVCGAAYDGVGVPACIASGRAAASAVVAALQQRRTTQEGRMGA